MNSQQKVFEELLKKSDFFNDVIETQRRGTTKVISVIVQAIIEQTPTIKESIIERLRDADVATGNASIDCETRRITRVIIADILQPPTPAVKAARNPSQLRGSTVHIEPRG
jgi:hypothetical protein